LNPIFLTIFDCDVVIDCDDQRAAALIHHCYSAFIQPIQADRTALRISVLAIGQQARSIRLEGIERSCKSEAEFLYNFEKELTIALQRKRPDLFFVHGAAVVYDGRCTILVGASGIGKSTLCWGLCNEGFAYLSDELAPINLRDMTVIPYPHALCIKKVPEGGYPLPKTAYSSEETMHIPFEAIPIPGPASPAPLAGIVFLERQLQDGTATGQRLGTAEAGARLYSHGLNQLAHALDGLPTVRRIAAAVPAWCLERSTPEAMREAIRNLVMRQPIVDNS
jgi:hypothetical protein